jgi:hypothetical protein
MSISLVVLVFILVITSITAQYEPSDVVEYTEKIKYTLSSETASITETTSFSAEDIDNKRDLESSKRSRLLGLWMGIIIGFLILAAIMGYLIILANTNSS